MFINRSFIVGSSLSYIFDNSLSDFIVFNSVLSLENSKKAIMKNIIIRIDFKKGM